MEYPLPRSERMGKNKMKDPPEKRKRGHDQRGRRRSRRVTIKGKLKTESPPARKRGREKDGMRKAFIHTEVSCGFIKPPKI